MKRETARRFRLDVRNAKRRIARFLAECNERQLEEGIYWYQEAQSFARNLAKASGFTFEQVAGVIAVTSPLQPWSSQKVFVPELLAAFKGGKPFWEVGFTFPANIHKAYAILEGDLSFIRGPKVTAFWLAICGDCQQIAVDRWITRAIYGTEREIPTRYEYRVVEQAFRTFGGQYKPRDLQAIIWVYVRDTGCGEQGILF